MGLGLRVWDSSCGGSGFRASGWDSMSSLEGSEAEDEG